MLNNFLVLFPWCRGDSFRTSEKMYRQLLRHGKSGCKLQKDFRILFADWRFQIFLTKSFFPLASDVVGSSRKGRFS